MKMATMVDMRRSPEEKAEQHLKMMLPSSLETPDVAPGLCLCLTHEELAKLDLDDDCEVGDLIHLFAMAEVTAVSKNDRGSGKECRIELAVVAMRVENESTEGPVEDDEGTEMGEGA